MTTSHPFEESALPELEKRFAFDGVTIKVPHSVPAAFRQHSGRHVQIDTSKIRSIVWLTPDESEMLALPVDRTGLLPPRDGLEGGDDNRSIAMANVFHDGQFWIGVIRPADVENVIMEQEVFLKFDLTGQPLAAHGQLRFLMKPESGIELHPQGEGQASYSGPPICDFIASAEAVPPAIEGFPSYDLVGGAEGWFRQSLRFISTTDKTNQMLSHHHNVNQYLLRLSEMEARRVLLEAIRRSDEIGLHTMYNTLAIGGTQCVFEAFNILDRAVLENRKARRLRLWFSRMFDRMPIFFESYLEARELLYDEDKVPEFPPLEEEVKLSPERQRELRQEIARLSQAP